MVIGRFCSVFLPEDLASPRQPVRRSKQVELEGGAPLGVVEPRRHHSWNRWGWG